MTKNSENKTNCPKNIKKIPAEWVAKAANTSPSLVRQIRNGARNADTNAGNRVLVTEMLLDEGVNKLIDEVKRIVKF